VGLSFAPAPTSAISMQWCAPPRRQHAGNRIACAPLKAEAMSGKLSTAINTMESKRRM